MDERNVAQRTRDEAIVQVVGAVILIAAYVALEVVQRKASDPDWLRTWRMRSAKATERFAASTAASWWQVAERARRACESDTA